MRLEVETTEQKLEGSDGWLDPNMPADLKPEQYR